jgi:hypothetical protein
MTNKKRLGLAIPLTLYEKIKEETIYRGKTINSLCLDVLWGYFEEKEKHGNNGNENRCDRAS